MINRVKLICWKIFRIEMLDEIWSWYVINAMCIFPNKSIYEDVILLTLSIKIRDRTTLPIWNRHSMDKIEDCALGLITMASQTIKSKYGKSPYPLKCMKLSLPFFLYYPKLRSFGNCTCICMSLHSKLVVSVSCRKFTFNLET